VQVRHESEIAAGADACWRAYVSEAYDAAVARRNGLREYRVVVREPAEGPWRHRVLHASGRVPPAVAPWLARLGLDPESALPEEQWRDDAARCLRFRLAPPALGERVRIEGEVRLEPAGAGACRRRVRAEVRVGIPLVGRALEPILAGVLREVHDKGAAVLAEMVSK